MLLQTPFHAYYTARMLDSLSAREQLLPVYASSDIQVYAPAKVIISRESFANDTAMANAYYILRDKEIELKLI